ALSLTRPESPRVEPNSIAVRVDATSLKLYPNPSKEELFIDIPTTLSSGNYALSLWDASGRLLQRDTRIVSPGRTVSFPVASLKAGNYFLKLEKEGRIYSGRFTKQ
ncbi:MAG: T9SS type A sorting domain-containing protein, partial [Bacteroidota bacterium]